VDSSEADLARALQFGDEGDWLSMAEHLNAALEGSENDPAILCWLGVAERELGLDGVAYERFKACLAAAPTDANLLAIAGNGLARFDDPESESVLRTATLMAPNLAYARAMYGAYLAREGMSEQALEELNVAVGMGRGARVGGSLGSSRRRLLPGVRRGSGRRVGSGIGGSDFGESGPDRRRPPRSNARRRSPARRRRGCARGVAGSRGLR
jgi:hypothetical protein